MANKDYYAGQQQYYPPPGGASPSHLPHVDIAHPFSRAASGGVLPSTARAVVSGIWPAPGRTGGLSAAASPTDRLRVRMRPI